MKRVRGLRRTQSDVRGPSHCGASCFDRPEGSAENLHFETAALCVSAHLVQLVAELILRHMGSQGLLLPRDWRQAAEVAEDTELAVVVDVLALTSRTLRCVSRSRESSALVLQACVVGCPCWKTACNSRHCRSVCTAKTIKAIDGAGD